MKKQEQKNKTVFHAVAALLAVLAVVLVLYGGGRWLEKRAEKPETRSCPRPTRRLWKWTA